MDTKKTLAGQGGLRSFFTIAGLVLAIAGAVALIEYFVWERQVLWFTNLWHAAHYRPFVMLVQLLALANVCALIWWIYLVAVYRCRPLAADVDLPTVTIVVPAYNEGRLVLDTIDSILASDYPAEKMQVISVDDGSKDDTWEWMVKAEAMHRGRVELVKQPRNMGKRHALYAGFKLAKGSVLVTIDSDSLVEPQTIRSLVSPFVGDDRVGAVAGNVRVLNLKEGILPRMLEVVFTYSFDFIRAAQSVTNGVFCTPGALSAYRSDVVLRHLEAWVDQTFCGKPANIGEDRALTNLILKDGLHVVFQRQAVVLTKVPTRYKQLCKMFLRWGRSNVRESIVMAKFVYRPFRPTPSLGIRINFTLSLFNLTLAQIMKLMFVSALVQMPLICLSSMSTGLAVGGMIMVAVYIIARRKGGWFWGLFYTPFYTFALSWIDVWSLLTPHRSGWLTRDLPAAGTRSALGGILRPLPSLATVSAMALGVALAVMSHATPTPVRLASVTPAQAHLDGFHYVHFDGDAPQWKVTAGTASMDLGKKLLALNTVEMTVFTKSGGIRFSGQSGRLLAEDGKLMLRLDGGVKASGSNLDSGVAHGQSPSPRIGPSRPSMAG